MLRLCTKLCRTFDVLIHLWLWQITFNLVIRWKDSIIIVKCLKGKYCTVDKIKQITLATVLGFSFTFKVKVSKVHLIFGLALDKIVFIALVFSACQCYGISRMETQYVTFSSKLVNKHVKFVLFYAIIAYYRKCAETSRECANCERHGPICCHQPPNRCASPGLHHIQLSCTFRSALLSYFMLILKAIWYLILTSNFLISQSNKHM